MAKDCETMKFLSGLSDYFIHKQVVHVTDPRNLVEARYIDTSPAQLFIECKYRSPGCRNCNAEDYDFGGVTLGDIVSLFTLYLNIFQRR